MRAGTNRLRRVFRGVAAGLLLWALAEVTLGAAAGAHIDTNPLEVTAGQPNTVQFKVQHGCGESPTIALAFSVPAGVRNMTGVAKDGWQITNDAEAVTFRGGELGAHTVEQFALTFTPTAAGPLPFPMIQTCRAGELAWISISQPGQEEPDYPAPVVRVIASAAPSTKTATSTATSTATADPTAPVTTVAAAVTTPVPPEPILPAQDELSAGFTALAIIGAVFVAGVVTVVVGVRIARRS
ncbi:MAG: DUF1775 domain-containing protein [Acidimicrobiales bacterium]